MVERANGIPNPQAYLGQTQDGRDWAMAALHPCGPEAPMNIGLPDTVSCAVTTPHYRGEFEIAFDVSQFATPPDPTLVRSWGVEILTPSIPEIACMYRLHDETHNVWSRWRVLRTPGFELPSGNGAWTDATQGATLRSSGYNRYRIVAKGETFSLNASDLNNQGRVISGQLNLVFETEDLTVAALNAPGLELKGGVVSQRIEYKVPATEQYLVATCPRVYQAEAKNGCYVIHKFDTPLLGYDFSMTGDFQSYGIAAASGVNPLIQGPSSFLDIYVGDDPEDGVYAEFDNTSYSGYVGDFGYAGITDRGTHPFVSIPSGMLTGCTFFVGLPIITGAPTPTIRLKTKLYLECLAANGAAVAPFSHPAPLRDMVAIDRVVGIMQQYDDAYPECYNDFGDIMGTIWDGIKTIGGHILNGARILTGIADGGGGLAGLASTVLPMLL